ncbi:MAG: CHAT domain-containing protein [Cytophagales bacterium]|nr:MAG: CHAT domain-containing protein [Cytophagales bacterium]
MLLRHLFFIIASLLLIINPLFAQNRFENVLAICERYYEDGDYKKALSRCNTLIKQYKRKDQTYTWMRAEPYLAKYYEAVGNFPKFEETIQSYLKHKAVKGEQTEGYGLGLLEVSLLYLEYGHLVKANQYLAQAQSILGKEPKNTLAFCQMQQVSCMTLFHQGYYKEFIEASERWASLASALINTDQYSYDDASQTFVTRKNNPIEVTRLKNYYGDILNYKAEAARRQGNYTEAERLLTAASEWIIGNLSNRSAAGIKNKHLQILTSIDQGKVRDEIRKQLERNLYKAERRFGTVHKDYLKLHESLIAFYVEGNYLQHSSGDQKSNFSKNLQGFFVNLYLDRRDLKRNKKQRWELSKNTSRYYTKERLPYSIAKRMDAKREVRESENRDAQRELLEVYKNINQMPSLHIQRAVLLNELVEVSLVLEDIQQAEKYLLELVRIEKELLGTQALSYHQAQMRLAEFYIKYSNKFAIADSIYPVSSKIIKARLEPEQPQYIQLQNQMADYMVFNEKFNVADTLLTQALQTVEKQYGKNHVFYAIQQQKRTNFDMQNGDYKGSYEKIQNALDVFKSEYHPTLKADFADVLETAADYYATMGVYDEARDLILRSSKLKGLDANSFVNSSKADQLATIYLETERFNQSRNIVNEVIKQREERYGADSRFLITPYSLRARLALIDGDFIAAQDNAEKSYKIAKKQFGEKSLKAAETETVLAQILAANGDFDEAETLLKQVIETQKRALGDKHISLAATYTQYALVLFYKRANPSLVEPILSNAEKIIAENLGTENPVYASAIQNSALFYTEYQQYEKAEKNLKQARKIREKLEGDKSLKITEIDVALADLATKKQDYTLATQTYKDAKKVYKKTLGKTNPAYIATLSKMARMYFAQGDLVKAEKNIYIVLDAYKSYIRDNFAALSDRERSKYWALIRSDFEFFNSLALAKPGNEKALKTMFENVMLTKPLLLSSSIKMRSSILSSGDTSLINNYNKWQSKQEELRVLEALSEEQLSETGTDLKEIAKEIEVLEKELSRQSTVFSTKEKPVSYDDLRAALKPNEVAIEIIRFRRFDKDFTDSIRYIALVCSANSATPQLISFNTGNMLEKEYLQYYRNCTELEILDLESYAQFWKPIDDQLDDKLRIFLSVDGIFSQLNVESLVTDQDGEAYVIDKNYVALVTSCQDLVTSQKNPSLAKNNNEYLLIGNPDFYPKNSVDKKRVVQQLPGAQKEVESVDATLKQKGAKTDTETGASATEEKIRNSISPKIFHIATHGYFQPDVSEAGSALSGKQQAFVNPLLRSGLLLTNAGPLIASGSVNEYNREDGILTADEVTRLKLDGTDLVVLSACETGRGDVKVGDGVYGLQRAFFIAGAKNLAMSLFKVSDEATQRLMILFYENLLRTGNKREAFIEAKKELRKEFPQPIYWGAFVMLGNS